jgi:hypothetical protein
MEHVILSTESVLVHKMAYEDFGKAQLVPPAPMIGTAQTATRSVQRVPQECNASVMGPALVPLWYPARARVTGPSRTAPDVRVSIGDRHVSTSVQVGPATHAPSTANVEMEPQGTVPVAATPVLLLGTGLALRVTSASLVTSALGALKSAPKPEVSSAPAVVSV